MDWDKIATAVLSLIFGFLGGFATIVRMKSDIQTLKENHKASREERERDRDDRDRMYAVFQQELREIRQSQERHYMNIVALIQGKRN